MKCKGQQMVIEEMTVRVCVCFSNAVLRSGG